MFGHRRAPGAAILRLFVAGPFRFPSAQATPDRVKLQAVHATGSKRFSEVEIARAAGMAVGAEVDPADFQQAAARLLETGEFAAVHYRYRPVPGGSIVGLPGFRH